MHPLIELTEQAIKARDTVGAAGAAERLILFSRVATALARLTQREADRLANSRRVRLLIRELQNDLMQIQKAASDRGPTHDQVRAYYATVSRLSAALGELERSMETITIFENTP